MSDKTFSEQDIEKFAAALSAAQKAVANADKHMAAGQQQQQTKHYRMALGSYDQALPLYHEAVATLQAVADLPEPLPMRLIQKQRATAIELRAAANQKINEIGGQSMREVCLAQMKEGQRLMEEARAAALDNRFEMAHDYAREAEKEDASLADEVTQFRRETPDQDGSNKGKLVAWLVALAVIGALIWFVGVPQTKRIWADLNPTPVAAAPTATPPLPTATPLASQLQPTPAPVSATVNTAVSVGNEASTTATTVFALTAGDTVLITHFIGAADSPVWLKVEQGGQRGWVTAQNLTFASPLPAALEEK